MNRRSLPAILKDPLTPEEREEENRKAFWRQARRNYREKMEQEHNWGRHKTGYVRQQCFGCARQVMDWIWAWSYTAYPRPAKWR